MLNRSNGTLDLRVPSILDRLAQRMALDSGVLGIGIWEIRVWIGQDKGVHEVGLGAEVCALGIALALVGEEGEVGEAEGEGYAGGLELC